MYKESLLLSVSNNLLYYSYLEKKENDSYLVVKDNNNLKIYERIFSEVKSMHWVKNNIFIQTNNYSYMVDWKNDNIDKFKNCNYIINKVCKVINKRSMIIEVSYTKGYKYFLYEFNNNKIYLLANSNTDFSKVRIFNNKLSYLKKIIKNNIFKRELSYKNYKIENKSRYLFENKWFINNYSISNLGYIDKCYLLKKGVIISINDFVIPTKIKFIKYKEIFYDNILQKSILFNHDYLTNNNMPTYFYKNNNKKKTVIFIHGGPRSSYLPYYNLIVKYFYDLDYDIFLPNYPGSLGYGPLYEEMLINRGGDVDIKYLKELVMSLEGDIYIYGESYGGYLALLLSFIQELKIKKIFIINGFTDINYQYIFSKSRKIIDNYFNLDKRDIKNINPINLIDIKKINHEIIFIHGKNDKVCDINQIEQFIYKYKVKFNNQIRLYKIRNITHQLEEYNEQKKIVNIMQKELSL